MDHIDANDESHGEYSIFMSNLVNQINKDLDVIEQTFDRIAETKATTIVKTKEIIRTKTKEKKHSSFRDSLGLNNTSEQTPNTCVKETSS